MKKDVILLAWASGYFDGYYSGNKPAKRRAGALRVSIISWHSPELCQEYKAGYSCGRYDRKTGQPYLPY